MLDELAALGRGLEDRPSPASAAQLDAVARFVRRLEAHEQRENGLMQSVGRDEGVGGQ
jgi:hypothetical protein